MRRALAFAAALAAAVAAPPALAADAKASPYAARGTCAGYPKVDLRTPAGWCVALLADASAGLRFRAACSKSHRVVTG
jgi:hypothetical protein